MQDSVGSEHRSQQGDPGAEFEVGTLTEMNVNESQMLVGVGALKAAIATGADIADLAPTEAILSGYH